MLVGGPVVTPGGIVDGGVAVRAGRITAIGGARDLPPAARTIELRGRVLLPGVIDPECHLGSHRPLASDVESERRAAAATGITTWGLQLNSAMMAPPPGGIQAPDQIPRMADAVPHLLATESLATVDFFLSPIITTDAQVGEIPLLARECGITSFKFHLQMAGPWGQQPGGPQPAYNFEDGTVFAACEAIAALGPPARVLFHCGNWQIARVLQQRLQAAGHTDMGAWDDHSPWLTEAAHARAYLYFCEVTGCPAYIVHCTTEQTIAEVRRARQAGVDVYSQVGVHYLVLDKDAWRINVPLRDRATHPALWRALADGEIDCVGSDHVAHNRPRAAMETGNAWTTISGFPSRVEGLLPMLLSEGVNAGQLTLERLAQVASETPARIFGLYPRKGVIQVGADADLVVVDLAREATVHAGLLHTATPWTIYEGWHVKGWPVMTLLRGEVVMEWPDDAPKAQIVGSPRGRYLRRPLGASALPAVKPAGGVGLPRLSQTTILGAPSLVWRTAMRLAVSDVVSPSYFVATAAVELGFFKAEGLDVEFVAEPGETPTAFRNGAIDFVGGSPYTALTAFPEWKGAKLLCALSQYTYWFLAMRADLGAVRGDLNAVKGRRISAAGRPGLALKRVLEDAGLDLERDHIQFVRAPQPPGNWARVGADAIEEGLADGFWGNGMRVEYAVRRGIATVLLDIRRGDGPPAARRYTFPALITTDQLIEQHPEAAAGAVRAIVNTQRALRADPTLATQVGQRLFPAEEAALIAELIARDAEFYDPAISEESVRLASKFAQDLGLLSGPVAYEDIVATQFASLWSQ